jgi:hypothetical protein
MQLVQVGQLNVKQDQEVQVVHNNKLALALASNKAVVPEIHTVHWVLCLGTRSQRQQWQMPLHNLVLAVAIDLILAFQDTHVADKGALGVRLEFTHLFFVFQWKNSNFAPKTTDDH